MNMLQDPAAFQQFMGTMMGFQGTTTRGLATGAGRQMNQQRPQGAAFQRSQFGGQGSVVPRGAFNLGGRNNRMPTNLGGRNNNAGNVRPPGPQPITPGAGRR
jgi:hypothetical protein